MMKKKIVFLDWPALQCTVCPCGPLCPGVISIWVVYWIHTPGPLNCKSTIGGPFECLWGLGSLVVSWGS